MIDQRRKKRTPSTADPEFWRGLWRDASSASPAARRDRLGSRGEIEHWNRRAPSYARQSSSAESRAGRASILSWLRERGALEPRFRVLDIGAGPGSFALPLSAKVREVVAVEPAEAMAAILERRIRSRRVRNIRLFTLPWQEIDLEREGWTGAFDLVFASMSPGVDGPEALEKMVSASRAYCYLSGWSGRLWGRWGRARSELWSRLFREDPGDYPNDILYPFGLLYAMGFRPELRFRWQGMKLEMASVEAERELEAFFERYTPITSIVRGKIAAYVKDYSSGGRFRQESRQCQAFMLWEVT